MLVFFFPFFENFGSYVYDSMRARAYGFVFERHQRSDFFVEKLYGMRARALAVHALAHARARGRRRRLGCSRSTRRQRRKVDKCRVADKKQTDKPTNTHYSFIGIDCCIHATIWRTNLCTSHHFPCVLCVHALLTFTCISCTHLHFGLDAHAHESHAVRCGAPRLMCAVLGLRIYRAFFTLFQYLFLV